MNKYDEIINLEFNPKHPRMSMDKRAAIFSPFAALTGYDDSIKETARRVDKKIVLDDNIKDIINEKLIYLNDNKYLEFTITYFVKDKYKDGGKYISIKNKIKKIDLINKKIYLLDNIINIDDILDIEY